MTDQVILCPFDYSKYSRAANQFASVLASRSGAKIVYLHVIASELFGSIDNEQDAALGELRQIQPSQAGVTCEHEVRHGRVVEEILASVAEHRANLVVIGARGRSGLDRLIYGSVAAGLFRQTSARVLCVHLPRG